MRAAEIAIIQQQASAHVAFAASPLRKYQQGVSEAGGVPRPAPEPLDTAAFSNSPLKEFTADVQRDLVYTLRPLSTVPEPVSTVHTPAYTRGSYVMHSDPGLRLTVDLGPLLWIHAQHGATTSVGRNLNEVA